MTKITEKHLQQSPFFTKIAGLALQLHWKRNPFELISCECNKIFLNGFFTEYLKLLQILNIDSEVRF